MLNLKVIITVPATTLNKGTVHIISSVSMQSYFQKAEFIVINAEVPQSPQKALALLTLFIQLFFYDLSWKLWKCLIILLYGNSLVIF